MKGKSLSFRPVYFLAHTQGFQENSEETNAAMHSKVISEKSNSNTTLKVGSGDGVPVLAFLSGVGSVFAFFAMMEPESPAPSSALYIHM
jgi:hypothetical protein